MLKNQKKKNKKGPFSLFKRVCILPLCTKFNIFVTRTICDQTKIKLFIVLTKTPKQTTYED